MMRASGRWPDTAAIEWGCRVALLAVALVMSGAFGGCGADASGSDTTGNHQDVTLRVFCAASTADAVQQIADRFEHTRADRHITLEINAAASSTLARQIEAGARCDVYISANTLWMDHLQNDGLIDSQSRLDLLGNQLVLIRHVDEPPLQRDASGTPDLTSFTGRVAMGDPDHVPAGRYGKQALERLGWWESLRKQIVPTMDVRSALAFVQTRQVPLGIVYASDAKACDDVHIAWVFDDSLHDLIVYPAALTSDAQTGAAEFLAFLSCDEASAIFHEAGFAVLRSDR